MTETISISPKPEIKCYAANHVQKICGTWFDDSWKQRIEKITNVIGEEWLWTGKSAYYICTHHVVHHCTVRDRNDIVINIHCHGNDGCCNCELFRTCSVRLHHGNSSTKTVTAINKIDVAINQDLTGIIVDRSKISTEYLYWILLKHNQRIKLLSQGSTIPGITRDDLMAVSIPYPPLQEQQKIATIISNVDELIQKTDQIIEQTQRLKKGLMQKLLTKGIGHSKFRRVKTGFKYMIEEYPEEWKILQLNDLCGIERGKFTHRPRDDPEFYGGKYPFIQTGDVERSNGYIRTYSQTLNENGLSVSKIFPVGIIALTIAGNIGSVAITTFPVCFPDSVVGITPSKIDLTFLFYFLQTRKSFLELSATVSAQPNINLETLKPLLIPVPPITEQQRISSILSNTDFMISKLINSKYKIEYLKKGLMQNLLTGKIRVKI